MNISKAVTFRKMQPSDFEEAIAMERSSLPPDKTWERDDFVVADCVCNLKLVAVCYLGRMIGFMAYGHTRCKFLLVRLCVHPEWRHRGVGTACVNRLTSRLIRPRTHIQADVKVSCVPMQLFLRRLGFQAVRTINKEMHSADEDHYLMVCSAISRVCAGERYEPDSFSSSAVVGDSAESAASASGASQTQMPWVWREPEADE